MTFRIQKRGRTWRLEGRAGGRLRRGAGERERFRLSLGTESGAAAQTLLNKIECALTAGPGSPLWSELRGVLPLETFEKLAAIVGLDAGPNAPPARPTWAELAERFTAWTAQRVALDKLRASTRTRYLQTVAVFGQFLKERGIVELEQIRRDVVDDFKAWRLARVLAKNAAPETPEQPDAKPRPERTLFSGRSVVLDTAILHRVFVCAVNFEVVTRNPVQLDGRPGDNAERGTLPFKGADLDKLRSAAGEDLLTFLLLRWTGLRGSDAVGLRWEEIDWDALEINRLTVKRRRRVVLPIPQELLAVLEMERDSRQPAPEDRVLLNPATGKPLTRPRLYRRIQMLGRRAGVPHAHPHRFRDTFAVDFLARGGSPYDVAKLLGDTVDTIEKHYAPFVRELRERARRIMEAPGGLEKTGTPRAQERAPAKPPN